jgi:hypothetical protein
LPRRRCNRSNYDRSPLPLQLPQPSCPITVAPLPLLPHRCCLVAPVAPLPLPHCNRLIYHRPPLQLPQCS